MTIDVHTAGRCTGQCCTDITLRANGGSGDVMTHAEVSHRQAIGMAQMVEENHLERFLVATQPDHFACSRYDAESHRCTIYNARPETCRTFPKQTIQHGQLSDTCRYCGFTA